MRCAITTPTDSSTASEGAARAAAERWQLPFVRREGLGLAALARQCGAEALLVLGKSAVLFAEGEERRWTAAMGALRAKRLAQGERRTADPFLEACGLRPGDAVLDGTLGLGADALVAAEAVGESGKVVGLESSPALAAWVGEGLLRAPEPAARRIEVRCADHATFLRNCPPKSFDVVVLDPMFRYGRGQASTFDMVRRLADPRPLEPRTLELARRAARRWVVVKDGAPGWDLARLSLKPLPSARGAKRLYARIEAEP